MTNEEFLISLSADTAERYVETIMKYVRCLSAHPFNWLRKWLKEDYNEELPEISFLQKLCDISHMYPEFRTRLIDLDDLEEKIKNSKEEIVWTNTVQTMEKNTPPQSE